MRRGLRLREGASEIAPVAEARAAIKAAETAVVAQAPITAAPTLLAAALVVMTMVAAVALVTMAFVAAIAAALAFMASWKRSRTLA